LRTHTLLSTRLTRTALVAASLVVAAGCGGGGSSGTNPIPNPGSSQYCDANNSGVQLARPTSGFPMTASNTLEIVANGNGDQLAQSFAQFDLNLVDNFGNRFVTGPLSLTSDRGGPQPYASDFYYNGVVQGTLPAGDFFTVYLNAPNTNCTLLPIGSLQT
jgi:hypothetical protein